MSIAHPLSSSVFAPRNLLLGSLALNLFFIGVTAALLIRGPAPVDRSVAARIDRLALTLPPADGDKLRSNFRAERTAIDNSRASYDRTRDEIRAVLRHEPFDVGAMKEAMARTRAARQEFDQLLQDVIAKAAAEMSPAGREKLAEWPSRSRSQRQR
jgi:uncharacterized membrane protein